MKDLKYDAVAVYTLAGRFTGLNDTERPRAQFNTFQLFTVILTETKIGVYIL